MDVLEAIMSRRSIRKYTGEPINEKDLETILKAGFQAPSAHNCQPREYIVVRDKEIIEKIAEVHNYANMFPKAGCGILVCGDKEKQKDISFLLKDCSASIQNILLAAHGLGLGAVWCGISNREELVEAIKEFCDLPEHIIPVGLVVIGVKDEEKGTIDRYDESKVHYDKW